MPDRKLRVLAVIDSLAAGGAERSLVDLIGPLRARGIDLDIAVLHDRGGLGDVARSAGATVMPVGAPSGRAATMGRLRTLIRARRPDLVHTTLFEAHLVGRPAARLAGVPVTSSLVSTPYGHDHRTADGLRSSRVAAAQVLDAATARLVTRFHAPAEHIGVTMADRLGLPMSRIDVVPRGRDPDTLGRRGAERRRRARAALGLGRDEPVALAVGRQVALKGFDVALEAWARWPDPQTRPVLLLAGREDGVTAQLRATIDRCGLGASVRLLGTRDDVADLLCLADVLVLPSRREGFPGVLVEALALETPVVASDLPGVRAVVGAAAGVLVPADDPGALAEGIISTLAHSELAATRAARGRVRFEERFTTAVVADAMAAFFERGAGRP